MTDQVACPRCQIGNLRATTGTYSTVYNGLLLSVPNVPAWKCDLCEYLEFEYDALTKIEALVGHFGLPDDHEQPTSKRPPLDSDVQDNNLPNRLKP
jgi:YgiT-type zinc finger domain-containing protein